MLIADLFYKFFKSKKNSSYQIMKYNSNNKSKIEDKLQIKILELDQKISENSTALVEAQVVKLRSSFSKANNFIEKIGQNVYKTKVEESINWHQKELKELYFRRRELQINLEKVQGIFWLNRIKRFIKIILIVFLMLLTLLIFISGFMIIIYLLPVIILIFLVNLLSTKKY